MVTLGIETSCDETSVSVTDDRKILSNIVTSSVHLHSRFGGVVPEIASRFHLEYITPVLREALAKSSTGLGDIELVAVTKEPGLIGSLLVGISMARSLGYSLSVPLIEVNHVMAHLYANMMHHDGLVFPLMGLAISGGHTSIIWMEDIDRWRVLGQTQDDAVGEAFDKVAKILGLGYPGGPVIEQRAQKGDPERISFPRSYLAKESLDFSYSGLKTAVLYYVQRKGLANLTEGEIDDICAAFQEAAFDMIVNTVLLACRKKKAGSIVVGGGVSANERLRTKLFEQARKWDIAVYFPPKSLCLDNAAMIAGLGAALYKKNKKNKISN